MYSMSRLCTHGITYYIQLFILLRVGGSACFVFFVVGSSRYSKQVTVNSMDSLHAADVRLNIHLEEFFEGKSAQNRHLLNIVNVEKTVLKIKKK